jgi:hypothetical protein
MVSDVRDSQILPGMSLQKQRQQSFGKNYLGTSSKNTNNTIHIKSDGLPCI